MHFDIKHRITLSPGGGIGRHVPAQPGWPAMTVRTLTSNTASPSARVVELVDTSRLSRDGQQ
ncbi:MAG: hypothetical protein IMW88_11775 [Thermoflavifilum sp.]|uniref:hypothetical protein n=1 Tax=Thermoflavifilum sp. TaxID=1968839 RepID=UPI0018A4BEBD|nr:hypothetical protein [Thermoflavifilum sp.]QOR75961.1 MAG: hypothetical protein IMW88_11775 [Thermoflavifilum sp.]